MRDSIIRTKSGCARRLRRRRFGVDEKGLEKRGRVSVEGEAGYSREASERLDKKEGIFAIDDVIEILETGLFKSGERDLLAKSAEQHFYQPSGIGEVVLIMYYVGVRFVPESVSAGDREARDVVDIHPHAANASENREPLHDLCTHRCQPDIVIAEVEFHE